MSNEYKVKLFLTNLYFVKYLVFNLNFNASCKIVISL